MASAATGMTYRHLLGLFDHGSIVGLEDGQLLSRFARSNDPAAFEALVHRHGPMVLATCRAVLKNDHDAEDAFQATFLVLAKKAGSVRGSEALGGWLHRVACRASVQARLEDRKRRRREEEAVARKIPSSTDTEALALLHEEIDRLPESLRRPLVLCDLEGLTYEEAARQLGWTVASLNHRLGKARRSLKARLARQGVLSLATGTALASTARAAISPTLARLAVASAMGGSPSSSVTILTHIVLRGLFMTRVKVVGFATLTALALTGALVAEAAGRSPDEPKPVRSSAVEVVAHPVAESTPGEVIEVRGLVVKPDGQPVAGASVRAVIDSPVPPETTTGADGRFKVLIPTRDGVNRALPPGYPWIVASSLGFGAGWVRDVFHASSSEVLTIRLVEEGPPIEGRVLDLEGRPVAGASVKVQTLWFAEAGGLDAWLAKVRDGQIQAPTQGGLSGLPMTTATRTGIDGRFRLVGLGRDRVATLAITAPTIASVEAQVLLREGQEIRSNAADRKTRAVQTTVFHSPRFEVAAAPTKPVEGLVRDKDTGQPIAGLTIQARVSDQSTFPGDPEVTTRTDAEGRYRLVGLPKATAYRLSVHPLSSVGLPYAEASVDVPAQSPGLDPVAFNLDLKRGVLVQGRVTDQPTGLPVTGHVHAYTFLDNPNRKNYLGLATRWPPQGELDADGRYRLVAIPGRTILACRSEIGRYRGGVGAQEIEGFNPIRQAFETVPFWLLIGNYHRLVAVDLDPKSDTAMVDIQVDPGHSLSVTALDPEGRPIGGTVVKGVGDLFQSTTYPQESPTFEVHALDPSRPRRVVITHPARKLVGSVYLRGNEPGPIVVRLEPWGLVSGRIVDEEGRPLKGLGLSSLGGSQLKEPETHAILPDGDWNNGILLGPDGRFRVEGLIPGLKYGATAVQVFRAGQAARLIGDVFKDLVVAPGEVKNLGDLKIGPQKP